MPQLAVLPLAGMLGGGALATAAAHLIVGVGTSLIANALMAKAQGGTRQDVKLQVEMGDDLALSFCVGDFATAGKRKYIGSWGKNRRYITEVIEYSCLPQDLAGFWVNDERGSYIDTRRGYVAASATPSAVGTIGAGATVPAGQLDMGRAVENLRDDDDTTDPRIWIKVVPGTQTAADPYLVWAFGADPDYPWTAAHIGRGKSYVIVTTQYDSDTLTSYPTFLWEPAPLPMYDPRKDSATGGTGAHRWNNRATYEPTRNAAVIAYNVARGIYWQGEWVFGGQNRPAWSLPRAAWVAAMAACDASVALAGGGSEPAYRAGLEISVDRPAADVLEALGLAANMRFAEVGGRIKPLVDLPAASAFSLDDGVALVSDGQHAAPFAPLSAVFNTLGGSYPSQVAKWTNADAPQFVDTAALAADGGRHLATSLSYEAAPYPHQVQRLMRGQMRDYRRERRHQLALPPAAMALEPVVDMLAFTSARSGYAAKHFLIEQAVRTMAMNVTLSLREVDPADYDWSPAWEMPVRETAPVALVPWVQAISGFTALGVAIEDGNGAARRAGIRLSCDGTEAGVREIWVQVRQSGATLLEHDGPFDFVAPHQWLVPNLIGDTAYQVRARLISTLTPRSVWTAWVDVSTPDVRLKPVDLDQQVWDQMGTIAEDAGVQPVSALPPAGDRDGQIVMLVPPGQLYRWDQAAGAWTANLYAGIPDGAITIAKHAAGLEPMSIHTGPSLPTSKSTTALSWNGKIYRWTGSAYSATVPAVDVTGQLSNAQIADLAAAKLTGAITGTQIADNAISTAKLAAGSVTTAKLLASAVTADILAANAVTAASISAGAITTAKLAAGAVTADTIATNAVTTAKIAAGAITAAEVAAGAITAGKMALIDQTNIIPNGWATDDPDGWEYGSIWTHNPVGTGFNTVVSGTGWGAVLKSKRFGVQVGDNLLVSYDTVASSGAASIRHWGRVHWFDSSGVALEPNYTTVASTTSVGSRRTHSVSMVVPAGAFKAELHLYANRDESTAGVTVAFRNMTARLRGTAQLLVDGVITSDKLATGAITADAIAASAILASKIAAGAVTTAKLDTASFSAAGLAIFGSAIQSANYAAGNAGWRITQAGAAEFANIISRSDLKVGSVSETISINQSNTHSSTTTYAFQTSGLLDIGSVVDLIFYGVQFQMKAGTFYQDGDGASASQWIVQYRELVDASWSGWITLGDGDMATTNWTTRRLSGSFMSFGTAIQMRVGYRLASPLVGTMQDPTSIRNIKLQARTIQR